MVRQPDSKPRPCGHKSDLFPCLDLTTQSHALLALPILDLKSRSQGRPGKGDACVPEENLVSARYSLVEKVENLESDKLTPRVTATT